MKTLFIINEPPHCSERCYNTLRLAHELLGNDPWAEVSAFPMADAVLAAKTGQKTPDGYYNVERMLKRVTSGKGQVLLCGTCMEAGGLGDDEMIAGARRSIIDELAKAALAAGKTLVF